VLPTISKHSTAALCKQQCTDALLLHDCSYICHVICHRWPKLLSYPAASFFALAAWLGSDEVGIKVDQQGLMSMLKQAPWLAEYDIQSQLRPVALYLAFIGVTDIERVLRAYPQVRLIHSICSTYVYVCDFTSTNARTAAFSMFCCPYGVHSGAVRMH
jgi:hypothetical protein